MSRNRLGTGERRRLTYGTPREDNAQIWVVKSLAFSRNVLAVVEPLGPAGDRTGERRRLPELTGCRRGRGGIDCPDWSIWPYHKLETEAEAAPACPANNARWVQRRGKKGFSHAEEHPWKRRRARAFRNKSGHLLQVDGRFEKEQG